jgi:hypothetical protein
VIGERLVIGGKSHISHLRSHISETTGKNGSSALDLLLAPGYWLLYPDLKFTTIRRE